LDEVSGVVDIAFVSSGEVIFTFDLEGLDTACADSGVDSQQANSCGIRFHAGTSCDDEDDVGGHFYNAALLDEDPWTYGAYYEEGAGTVRVLYGESIEDTIGRAFVLHDRAGTRIACQLVSKAEIVTATASINGFDAYPDSCVDNLDYVDPEGYKCKDWKGYDCVESYTSYTFLEEVQDNCPVSCGFCDPVKVPTGRVEISYRSSGAVEFTYFLGADDDCALYGPDPDTANSCGIHFHEGTSCDTADEVGGHYWNSDMLNTDPWTYGATYYPDDVDDKDDKDDDDDADKQSGRRRLLDHDDKDDQDDQDDQDDDDDCDPVEPQSIEGFRTARVVYGFSAAATEGRTFVLHDRDGNRISCNLVPSPNVQAMSAISGNFAVYPEYDGDLDEVSGVVNLDYLAGGSSVTFTYDLQGVDPDCADGPDSDTANSCGIHFHAGTSCETVDEVGGHYWNSNALEEDPFTYDTYYTDARGSVTVTYGYDALETEGRTFVLHDKSGTRIVCEVISAPDATCEYSALRSFATYPGYDGDLAVSGKVDFKFLKFGSVQFKYKLYGVDPDCEEFGPDPEQENSCGIHFHAGTSCDEEDEVGGHYWNSLRLEEDPWTFGATYTKGKGKEMVYYGYGSQSTIGRAFVLHDRSGTRISCDLVPGFMVEDNMNSCSGLCGTAYNDHYECQCDDECVVFGDCCVDHGDTCVCPVDEQSGPAFADSNCAGLQIGGTCTQDCAFGYYNANGGGSYTCTDFGEVTGEAIQCEPVYCEKDQYVDNFVCTDCPQGEFSVPQPILNENTVCSITPVVTCAFTAEDEFGAFYVNEMEIDVIFDSNKIYFLDELDMDGAVLAVAMNVNNCDDDCSTQGGFQLACVSDNADSYWNMVYTDTSDLWTSFSGPTAADAIPEWNTISFDTSVLRATHTAEVSSDECTALNVNAEGIIGNPGLLVGSGAFQYNWFRTGVCENSPDFGVEYELDDMTTRNERTVSCAAGYVKIDGASRISTCDATGQWSPVNYCEQAPSISCNFAGDGITRLYIDSVDYLADASDIGNGLRQLIFYIAAQTVSTERAVIAIEADTNKDIYFSCSSTDESSVWNEVETSSDSWLSFARDSAFNTQNWKNLYYDVSGWTQPPVESQTGIYGPDSAVITPAEVGQYAYFRTAICSINDQQGAGYEFESDGAHVLGSSRDTICVGLQYEEEVEGVAPTAKTCLPTSSWSDSTGCVKKAGTTCSFVTDGEISGVYWNGKDVTADVVGDLADPAVVKTLNFAFTNTRRVLAIEIVSSDSCVSGGCEASTGLAFACVDGDSESAWNNVYSDNSVKTNSALDDTTTSEAPWEQWYLQSLFNDEFWYEPISSTSGLNIDAITAINPFASLIWADSYYTIDSTGYQYGYFRTAVCSVAPIYTKYSVADGGANVGDSREVTCSIQSGLETGVIFCESDGTWSKPFIEGCQEDETETTPPGELEYCPDNVPRSVLTGQVLEPYFTYSGTDSVYFSLFHVSYLENSVSFILRNFVADQACAAKRDTSNPESCQIYIMSGTSCSSPGIPHFNQALVENPWGSTKNTHYLVGSQRSFEVNHGYGYEETVGHAVVVFDFNGAPMACTLLPRQDKTTQIISFDNLIPQRPGYDGTVVNQVTVDSLEFAFGYDDVDITYSNLVADSRCATGFDENKLRSCRIMISNSLTCDTGLGSFWGGNIDQQFTNPWLDEAGLSRYTDGVSDSFTVKNCRYFEESVGRVLLIFDYTGKALACQTMTPEPFVNAPTIAVGDMAVVPGYSNPDVINNIDVGDIYISFLDDNSIQITYSNLFVDPSCNVGRACGCLDTECAMQIYSATSCDDIVKGETFDIANVDDEPMNPWKAAYYYSSGSNGRSFNVKSDKSLDDVVGRTLVVHDRAGDPVLCTVLDPSDGSSVLIDDIILDSALFGTPSVLVLIGLALALQ
jgi:hypothetical protein